MSRPVERISYTRVEAAASLGMSLSHFQRYVQPHVPCFYVGQLRLFPVAGLRKYAEENAYRPADEACDEEPVR